MAGSRSTPPLFDLLRAGSERAEDAKPVPPPAPRAVVASPSRPAVTAPISKPVVRLEPKPVPPAGATVQARPAEPPARAGSRQTVTIAVVWAWLALAGVLASWLVVWGIAYSAGRGEAEHRLAWYEPSDTPVPPPITRQPTTVPIPAAKGGAVKPPVGGGNTPDTVAKAPPARPAAPVADTRQAGYNYLLCASQLDKASAEAAAGYLTQNGVPAIAVPGGKGGSKFTVYALLGIPSGSLDDQLTVRNDHKAEVARLGKQWKKDHPGSPDFSDAYWEKYRP